MSIARKQLEAQLVSRIPEDITENLLKEYLHIRQQFFLRRFQPSELNGARFCECVLRILEHLSLGAYTPFGRHLNSDQIIRTVENNTALPDTIRIFIPRLIRVVLDVRNKRDVAHVGGEVSPNYSDSLLIVHSTDWILTELVRHFHTCSISEAQRMVESINETRIPIVVEVDGFVRVQNTKLETKTKALVVLYFKYPVKVLDGDLVRWTKYTNPSRFKREILPQLDADALIHYDGGYCTLLPKGRVFVEQNVSFDLLV
jgi:hypothetical protein